MDDRPPTGTIFGRHFKRNLCLDRPRPTYEYPFRERTYTHCLGTSEPPPPLLPWHLSSNSFADLKGSIVLFPAGFDGMKTITEKP